MRGWRVLTLLFLASLLVRLLFLWPVVAARVQPLYDENDYLQRAVAWREILGTVAAGERPTPEVVTNAYGGGDWPPLHPMLLALGLLFPGAGVGAARLVVALISAATTPLVYALTRRLASDGAARAAALLHLAYPGFVAYSHYLWSESTYMLLLLASMLAALDSADAPTAGSRTRRALVAGICLGGAALTRAGALPVLAVLPVWLSCRLARLGLRPLAAVVVLLCSIGVLLPWLLALRAREGHWVPVSTMTGYNLALGNNPWVPPGYGSCWGIEPCKARLMTALESRAAGRGGNWKRAAAGFAREQVAAHPMTFLRRSAERLRMLWAPEFFPLRHLSQGVYPALPTPVAVLVLLAVVGGHLLFGLAAIAGLLGWKTGPPGGVALSPGLLLLLVLAGSAAPLLTVAIPRLNLPVLALLLPAAGHGLVLARHHRLPPARWLVPASLGFVLLSASALPLIARRYLMP